MIQKISTKKLVIGNLLAGLLLIIWASTMRASNFAHNYGNYENQRIDKSKDSICIEFYKIETVPKGRKIIRNIWLRLRNNTTFELVFLSIGGSPLRIENKKLTTEIEEGGQVSVYYELETEKGRKPSFYRDNYFVFTIRPGFSFTFFISEEQIKTSYEIIIPFNYSWEGIFSNYYPVRHEVRYCWACEEDLPDGIKKIGKKRKSRRMMEIKYY